MSFVKGKKQTPLPW